MPYFDVLTPALEVRVQHVDKVYKPIPVSRGKEDLVTGCQVIRKEKVVIFSAQCDQVDMKKDEKHSLDIIKATPLVSVDLIIRNPAKEVLLGKRVNRPAQGYWFVPGGRIRKNEKISQAVKRVSEIEVGIDLSAPAPRLLGVFEHIYEDNFFNAAGINTHYIVIAFLITLQHRIEVKPDEQHTTLQWWGISKLLEDPGVHQNTKLYFK